MAISVEPSEAEREYYEETPKLTEALRKLIGEVPNVEVESGKDKEGQPLIAITIEYPGVKYCNIYDRYDILELGAKLKHIYVKFTWDFMEWYTYPKGEK
jgi:hypothetical protein